MAATEWAADSEMRRRAVPRGTVGKRIAGTNKPWFSRTAAAFNATSLLPNTTGRIGVVWFTSRPLACWKAARWPRSAARRSFPSREPMNCSEVRAAWAMAGGGAVEAGERESFCGNQGGTPKQ